jgi:Fic/DOC family
LTETELCRWQGMLTDEQSAFGHSIAADGIGRLRSCAVRVGNHIAPPSTEVPALLRTWMNALNQVVSDIKEGRCSDILGPDVLGDYFQRFEAIHPFVDGNGRTGRLIVNYIATVLDVPIIVFRLSERQAFYAAHRSKMAMRCFMADKYREAMFIDTGVVLERAKIGSFADIYNLPDGETLIIEQHELINAQEQWAALAAAKVRTASGGVE